MNKLYTAAEIAQMHLPGLPTTKSNVLARAAREGWHYEEQPGLGGVRKLFQIPEKYQPDIVMIKDGEVEAIVELKASKGKSDKVAGTIAAGTAEVDESKLALAARVLEEWAAEKGLMIKPERKGAIIAILYKMLMKGAAPKDMEMLLRAGNDF